MELTLQRTHKVSFFSTEPQINVLHIIKSLGRGGAEKLLPETLLKHDKNRFCFHYIYFLPWKGQLVNDIEDAGGTVTCIPAKSALGILLQIRKLLTYIRENHIHVVHCHLPVAGIAGRIAGLLAGVPVVYTEHNKWERYHKITYLLNKYTFSRQTKVIAVSNDVAKSIHTNYKRKLPDVQVIFNGVDTDKFSYSQGLENKVRYDLEIPADAVVIGITCVFRKQKRLETWLEIAAELHSRYPDLYFIVVGDGVLRDQIAEKAKSLQCESYVKFAGLQPDIRPFLQSMDIYMMSSEFEGLPVGLLEAMSMGCLPACTNAGGTGDIINNGVNGILVPVNEPMNLCDGISSCIEDAGKMEALRQEARNTAVQYFGIQHMVNELEKVYSSIVKTSKPS